MLVQENIKLLYKVLLNREADPSGLQTWGAYVKGIKTDSVYELASAMIQSEEFLRLHKLRKASIWDTFCRVTYEEVEFTLPYPDFTYLNLSVAQTYEPYVSSHMFSRLSGVRTFVDVGANLGLFTLPLAKKIPHGHIYSFEASSRNANVLQQNVWANSIQNVTVYPLGLSDVNGCLYFSKDRQTSNNTLVGEGNQGASFEVVPVVTLDGFWNKEIPIDMVKIDIEGHEYKFFKGAMETVRRNMPMIYLEYSDEFQKLGSGQSGASLLSELIDIGYGFEILHREKPSEKILGSKYEIIEQINSALTRHITHDHGSHLDLFLLNAKPDSGK